MDDVKIKVIDSDKLVKAINEGSYDINLSAVMALGAVMMDSLPSAQPTTCKYWDNESGFCALHRPSAQPEPCKDAVHAAYKHGKSKGIKKGLGMLKNAQSETCEGCKHFGKWENEVEYGYPSPCTRCKRRVEDHYER